MEFSCRNCLNWTSLCIFSNLKIFKFNRLKNKMGNSFDWFKTKKATSLFALISLAGGFFFLNQGITGNIILNENYTFNLISLIGLFLILCSVILGAYSLKKK